MHPALSAVWKASAARRGQRIPLAHWIAIVALGIPAPAAIAAQQQTARDSGEAAYFRPHADAADSLAGFPPLAHDAMVRGREVRVYVFGMLVPYKFIRLLDEGDGGPVHGARGITWQSGLAAKVDRRGLDSAQMAIVARLQKQETGLRQHVLARYDCVELHASADAEGCLLREPQPRDWGAILRSLDSLGVFELPGKRMDVDELDGVILLFTVRDTRGYRIYSYWTPEPDDPDSNVRAAAEIMRRVSALFAR